MFILMAYRAFGQIWGCEPLHIAALMELSALQRFMPARQWKVRL